jgi:hypothetical protein
MMLPATTAIFAARGVVQLEPRPAAASALRPLIRHLARMTAPAAPRGLRLHGIPCRTAPELVGALAAVHAAIQHLPPGMRPHQPVVALTFDIARPVGRRFWIETNRRRAGGRGITRQGDRRW